MTEAVVKPDILPTNIEPQHYHVSLKPDLAKWTFEGHVDVTVLVHQATDQVVLHATELAFQHAQLDKTSDSSAVDFDEKEETATIKFPQPIGPGEHVLSIDYTGVLNDRLVGFYRSKYVKDGDTRYHGVTQFEPTDARRALPCWDEPAVKATFTVTLHVPKDLVAVSNMPEQSRVPYPEDVALVSVTFAKTPKMSTYLLAWVVGEFDHIADKIDGVDVRVYTPVGASDQALPKIDLLAIPDFGAGAMENWGCITYRETALLIDEQKSSAAMKQRVARVVCHELAHQWFGNLVTMQWWDDLFLNESFARFTEHIAVDAIFPDWQIWTQYVDTVVGTAFSLDAMTSSHPIHVSVAHAREINEIFDAISYAKGASVLRMLNHMIGAESFRLGLCEYLKKHAYGNATHDDLWAALSAAADGQDVKGIMDAWIGQIGFPVVSVTVAADDTVTLTQHRFLASGIAYDDPLLWPIPVSYRVLPGDATAPATSLMLTDRTVSVSVPGAAADGVLVNAGATGFFRVMYDASALAAVAKHLPALAPVERLALVSDAMALLDAGDVPMVRVLDLALQLRDETEYPVWCSLASGLAGISDLIGGEPFADAWNSWVAELLGSISGKLGWQAQSTDTHLTAMFRALILGLLCRAGEPAAVAEATRQFADAIAGKTQLVPELRFVVFKTAIAHGGEAEYKSVLQLYQDPSSLPEERRVCLRALGASKDPELLRRTLDFALTDSVRSQDIVFPLSSVASNPAGRDLAWQWMQANWEHLKVQYGRGNFLMANIIKAMLGSAASDERADEAQAFFAAHGAPGGERAVKQTIEKIHTRAMRLLRARDQLPGYLA